jgi:hypothetical protein
LLDGELGRAVVALAPSFFEPAPAELGAAGWLAAELSGIRAALDGGAAARAASGDEEPFGVCWAEPIWFASAFGDAAEELFEAAFCWLISGGGVAVATGAPLPMPVFAEADGPPPVLPDPQ